MEFRIAQAPMDEKMGLLLDLSYKIPEGFIQQANLIFFSRFFGGLFSEALERFCFVTTPRNQLSLSRVTQGLCLQEWGAGMGTGTEDGYCFFACDTTNPKEVWQSLLETTFSLPAEPGDYYFMADSRVSCGIWLPGDDFARLIFPEDITLAMILAATQQRPRAKILSLVD